ncbi:cupin domain-containing protein [Nonomuraea endophytica]|uniref:Ribosomal protein L16 Arg81 hydroxylase n=1 Tax=Nonomuraea endophytica TaxID=714136 RepID=A0A7W8EIQ5_9ACTN|nr:cupin domain-containing protein [Nonomuraea endophytica]MBB5082285.1 ribosomal protein L16 Arg81 hydroxylase [Nonomuraea endophytica]
MTVEFTLAQLLQPLTVETFLQKVWGVTHYHVERGREDYFDSLFGPAAVEDVLEIVRPEPSAVVVVREDDHRSPDSYRFADGTVDLVRIRNAFADGDTIVLNGVERYVPAIATLAHGLEVELNFETQVNAYITPPGSRGFLPHYDDHDVLVLQVRGSKTWHVHGDAGVPPHKMRRREKVVASGLPAPAVLRLNAGDVLYLPRGRVHAATANAEPSIHLTVGIHAPTVLKLITEALESLSYRDDRVLAQLPPRHVDDVGVRASLDGLLRDMARAIEDPAVMAEGFGALGDALVRRGRCRPVGQLVTNAVEAPRIDGRTRVVKYQPLYSRVLMMADGVALQFAQSLVNADADHRAAMLFLSGNTEPFEVRDLPELSEAQQIELARTLVVDGFLVRL